MRLNRILLLLALPFYLFSCAPQQKLPNYLEDLTDSTYKEVIEIQELKFQKNDLISILIFSTALKPEIDQYYNLPVLNTGTPTVQGQSSTTGGFLVDINGNIEHPRLGLFHAEGKTKQQLAAEVKKRLTEPVELLTDPTVIIRFLNYKITVIGEVAKPGNFIVPGERITILEAIGLSGDITQYGRKNTIKVIREIDGKIETGFVDLSSKDFFKSPYYNLIQNDVVMVEPSLIKARSAEQAVVAQKVSFALTIATVAASLANIFIRN